MRLWTLVLSIAIALAVGVATATAAGPSGGNAANAKLCQKGGWQTLVRSDSTVFTSEEACVSYAANGGTLKPKPTCTAGTEDFSEDAEFSKPTAFAGGTIETAYGLGGGVYPSGLGGFSGQNVWSGLGVNSFQLTFDHAVSSVQLDAESPTLDPRTVHLTLTAYDASNAVVDSDSVTQTGLGATFRLSVSSSNNNIKYFTIATDDPQSRGVTFNNIVWGCAV